MKNWHFLYILIFFGGPNLQLIQKSAKSRSLSIVSNGNQRLGVTARSSKNVIICERADFLGQNAGRIKNRPRTTPKPPNQQHDRAKTSTDIIFINWKRYPAVRVVMLMRNGRESGVLNRIFVSHFVKSCYSLTFFDACMTQNVCPSNQMILWVLWAVFLFHLFIVGRAQPSRVIKNRT